jgi:hypothetical protein
MSRISEPTRVSYTEGSNFPHRQLVSPRKVLVPQDRILGERRENVDCNEAAIAEAIEGFHADEMVTIAAGALRSVFGDLTAADMGVPTKECGCEDHHAIIVRVGAVRDALKSTDRRRSHAGHRS